jgi:hypothetical protein
LAVAGASPGVPVRFISPLVLIAPPAPPTSFPVTIPPLPPLAVTVVIVCVPDVSVELPPGFPFAADEPVPPVPTVAMIVLPGVRLVRYFIATLPEPPPVPNAAAPATANVFGGNGGATPIFGGGALGGAGSSAGAAGINPGCGGSGGGTGANNAGGNGANGLVLFEWVN